MKLKASTGHIAFSPIPGRRICLCDLSGSFYIKKIKLSQGKFALVDAEDYDYLMQWCWCAVKGTNTFYAARNDKFTGTTKMHRVIMNAPKGMEVDHINRDGLDNRKENLRIVTRRGNQSNRRDQLSLMGAYTIKGKFYYSRIGVSGKSIYLGSFKTAEQAHEAYIQYYKSLLP